jgi:hypothetical protein
MRRIPYFWIRDVDPQTYMRVLKIARARKQSLADTARELLFRNLRADASEGTSTRRLAAIRKVKVQARRI